MNGQSNLTPEAAVQYMQRVIESTGISPEIFVHLGNIAERVLEDNSLYKQLIEEMISLGVATEDELEPKLDFRLVVSMITLGKAAERMTERAAQ